MTTLRQQPGARVLARWRDGWRAWRVAARNRASARRCFYCDVVFAADGADHRTVDHRLARSRGGSGRLRNLVFACFACNQRKRDLDEETFVSSDWLAERRGEVRGRAAGITRGPPREAGTVSVLKKLQIKPGQRVAVLGGPEGLDLGVAPDDRTGDADKADAVVAFVRTASDLESPDSAAAVAAARRDALAWVAYPKASQLDTDLNRDSLAAALVARGTRPVRQIAIDDVWSALRFRPGGG